MCSLPISIYNSLSALHESLRSTLWSTVGNPSFRQQSFVSTMLTNCVTFSVAAGTGCQWMCQYCAEKLGTASYYFTDNVCHYGTSGCEGNPMAGVNYTCCKT